MTKGKRFETHAVFANKMASEIEIRDLDDAGYL